MPTSKQEPAGAGGGKLTARVIIIEDQRLVSELFAAHCSTLGLTVLAQCGNLAEGMTKVRDLRPDLALMDFALPDGDGLEAAKTLMLEMPTLRVIGISSHRDPWTMIQVQRSGLHGFVDKNEQRPEVLSEAIEAVLFGRTFYTPVVGEASAAMRRDPKAFVRVLSDYELRVLSLIGEAKEDAEIGAIMGVSGSTIQSRRRDIMKKLGIHSTPKLIHFAITQGLTRHQQME